MKVEATQKQEANLEDLFEEQLEDLYDAEKQIVDALPKLIANSSSEVLAGALQDHLEETKVQVTRLETIFDRMGQQPGSRHCTGMEGLLTEGDDAISNKKKSSVLDLTIIAAAQKVEHYEIAAYGTVCALGESLGQPEVVELLHETLEEERNADDSLTEVAESILSGEDTADAEEEEDEDEDELDEEEEEEKEEEEEEGK